MAEFFECLNDKHIAFIKAQPMFFIASAAAEGRINLSPKGLDAFRVISPRLCIYLDITGSGNETAAHAKAGGRAEELFTQSAVVEVHRHATGIPRVMSVICDNALISGFASNQRPVDSRVISEVCSELEFVGAERDQGLRERVLVLEILLQPLLLWSERTITP